VCGHQHAAANRAVAPIRHKPLPNELLGGLLWRSRGHCGGDWQHPREPHGLDAGATSGAAHAGPPDKSKLGR